LTAEPTTTLTAAEKRAAQVSRLLAEKDARMQQHRQRPLPAWLASRGNRCALALLPLVPLATGIYAATRPDDMVRSALLLVVAVVTVAGILLLRRSTRLLDAVPNRLLDEREIGERDRAHRHAYGFVTGLGALLALIAVADSTVDKVTGTPLVLDGGWITITMTAVLVNAMIPAAVLAWRWEEPMADTDD
jgi:hypothetical protein